MATLDGVAVAGNGYNAPDIYNVVLFSHEQLDDHQHELIMQNQWSDGSATWLDIDYIVITAGDGDSRCAGHV